MAKLAPKRKPRPGFDRLERRDVPATWGLAWPEAQHLTVSFIPDGTQVEGQSSQLFRKLDGQLGAGNWQGTILDALQTWAMNSNINVGTVPDGGQEEGTAGAAQGDPRFGDIRIGAVPLPGSVAAITGPYDPAAGTYSGDVILNSNIDFSAKTGEDLFTVALHEAGHVFGFADSDDPASFMYDVYQGPQAGLSPAAISALQGLYGGPRNLLGQVPGSAGTDPGHPLDLTNQLKSGAAPPAGGIVGDLTAAAPGNYFQFQSPTFGTAPFGVDLQVQVAGISQLQPQVTVTNAQGAVVARVSSANTPGGALAIHLNPSSSNGLYKLQVAPAAGAGDGAVGSYLLVAGATKYSLGPNLSNGGATPLNGNSNATTAPLAATAAIGSAQQQDLYRFTAPSQWVANARVQLQANGVGLSPPQVDLYSSSGARVATATATDPQGSIASLTVGSLTPGATYYIKVTTGTLNAFNPGLYQLSVSYNNAPSSAPPAAAIIASPWLGRSIAGPSAPNTSPAKAAPLATPAGFAPNSFYAALAGLGDPKGAQYYSLTTPQSKQPISMTLSVQGINGSSFVPWVTVLDASGNPLPFQVLADSGGVDVIQVPCAANAKIVVKVASSAAGSGGSTGNYYLAATFGTVASSLGTLAAGTTGTDAPRVWTVVTPPSPTVYQFVLAGDAANAGTDAVLRLTVTDASGNVVATLTSAAAEAASISLMLTDPGYSIAVDAYSPSGAKLAGLKYSVAGMNLTDPIKVYASSGGGTTSPQA